MEFYIYIYICVCSGLHKNRGGQQGEGGDCPPSSALGCREVPSGVLFPAVGPPAQEGRGALGVGPEEDYEDGLRAGATLL